MSTSYADLKMKRTQKSTVLPRIVKGPSHPSLSDALPVCHSRPATKDSEACVSLDSDNLASFHSTTPAAPAPSSAPDHSPLPPNIVPFPSKLFKTNKFVELCIDKHSPSRGRGLFSKTHKPIKPGVTLLSLTPHVAVLDTQILSSRCSGCFLEAQDIDPSLDSKPHQIRRCTRCKVVAYCGANCQRLDWPSHKPECKALVNFAHLAETYVKSSQKAKSRIRSPGDGFNQSYCGSHHHSSGLATTAAGFNQEFCGVTDDPDQISTVPSASVRALARLIWNKKREEEKDPHWWKALEELQSQLNAYSQLEKERLMQLSVTLSRYVGGQTLQDVLSSASTLLPFCCRFLDNSFTLTSTTLDNIGVVLCGSAAFMNHSCSPNAVVVFPEGGEGASKKAGKEWVRVIAIKRIEPGEEILTSYVDLAGTLKERQDELAQRLKFICQCAFCNSNNKCSDEVDPREALKCPKCTNWFSLLSPKCSHHEPGHLSGGTPDCSRRDEAGPSSPGEKLKREICCPTCGFSRLIDVEGQRLAIKKSGQALDAQKEPAKAAYYAEKAIEWFQNKLLPFTFGPGFYPVLNLRRMKMISHLMCKTEDSLKQATQETQQIITGVHMIYGVGHPISIITKSTITKLCGWSLKSSTFDLMDGDLERIKLGLKMLESLKEYQTLALEECLIGFGLINGGGRLGRLISFSIIETEREIDIRNRLLMG